MTELHTSVAIAQVAFYAPIVPLSLFIFLRNVRNRPLQPWYPLVLFSLMRLLGGLLTIAQETSPDNVRLGVAASALLNIGLVPLLFSTIGILRYVLGSTADLTLAKRGSILDIVTRIALAIALLLLVLASATTHQRGTSIEALRALALSGYVIMTCVLALATAELTQLHVHRHLLGAGTLIYVQVALLGTPALILRTLYGLLFEYTITDEDPIWNPLHGSVPIFILMCLIPEYMTLLLYMYLGFHRMNHAIPELEKSEDVESGTYCMIGGLRVGWTVHRYQQPGAGANPLSDPPPYDGETSTIPPSSNNHA
ncbi:hypothetical protein B0T10DRAFT_558146 [Thelonectria olida]|uniref:DUF7702 domain-containing protein n=1 Tax=Thelonectria olida TaxID=1576542 RepID=A0A9P8WDA3_9HYPO|nr:hypothetical protein B0T10DRAFT_558146 [Thelonectria olida]